MLDHMWANRVISGQALKLYVYIQERRGISRGRQSVAGHVTVTSHEAALPLLLLVFLIKMHGFQLLAKLA